MESNMEQETGYENKRMDARGLAEFLGWSRQSVYQRVTMGADLPPSVKSGNRRWWILSDVLAWENERKEETHLV